MLHPREEFLPPGLCSCYICCLETLEIIWCRLVPQAAVTSRNSLTSALGTPLRAEGEAELWSCYSKGLTDDGRELWSWAGLSGLTPAGRKAPGQTLDTGCAYKGHDLGPSLEWVSDENCQLPTLQDLGGMSTLLLKRGWVASQRWAVRQWVSFLHGVQIMLPTPSLRSIPLSASCRCQQNLVSVQWLYYIKLRFSMVHGFYPPALIAKPTESFIFLLYPQVVGKWPIIYEVKKKRNLEPEILILNLRITTYKWIKL